MNRRRYLRMMGAAAAGSMVSPLRLMADAGGASLKEIARSRGILFGAESDVPVAKQVPAYGELILNQCELFAPQVSWQFISSQPGVETFADANVAWGVSHGLRFTGGQLLWYRRIPDWAKALGSDRDFEAAVLSHIKSTCTKFPGKVFSWNVANEAIDPKDGRPDGLRDSDFTRRMGPSCFDAAFRQAREAAPGTVLAYNDYGIEVDTRLSESRRDALLRLVEGMKKRNVPIDAVGLQSHIHAEDMEKFDERSFRRFLADIASMNLKIMISEFDVLDVGTPGDLKKRDRAIADIYRKVLSVALDEKATISLVTWGLANRFSWYNVKPVPGKTRSDGAEQRPLPFDSDLQPTPVYDALASVLKNAPSRKPAA